MPRMYEIPGAFDAAIVIKDGRRLVSVRDFIHELTLVNHHFSPSQANAWIQRYMPGWKVYEEGDYGFNIYTKFNPNGR